MPPHTLDASSIVFCSGTLLGRPLADKIEAAVAGGFDGITLFPQDVQDAHAAGWSDAEIGRRISDAGLQVEALDPFLAWLPGDVPDAMIGVRSGDFYVASEAEFFERCHHISPGLFERVQARRGSISAEHGVGLLKRDFLSYSRSPAELEAMRGLKQVFDPNGVLNPGKLL